MYQLYGLDQDHLDLHIGCPNLGHLEWSGSEGSRDQ
jgi:hypothetical protein